MILVFGGTTEGKLVAKILDDRHIPYYYSTKMKVEYSGKGTPIFGEMTPTLLTLFCKEHGIAHIINASHPFAVELHQNIAELPITIPILRFEREFSRRISHPSVYYVDSFEEALQHFATQNYQSLLALSGVQTIAKLSSYWNAYPSWFRILDRDSSRAIAKASDFPEENLHFGYPQSKTEEIALFTQIAPEVIFTKESGTNGKLEAKIQAALAVHIPIVILKKPKISNRYICVSSATALIPFISNK